MTLSSVLLIPAFQVPAVAAHDHDDHEGAGGVPELVTVHEPELPPGIRLSDPTDTDTLREKAGVEGDPVTKDGTPKGSLSRAATRYFPSGPSVIPGFNSHVAPACVGSGTDGRRVRVLYAREANDPSRMAALRASFLNEIAQVDDLFAYASDVPGQNRRVRWHSDSTCQPTIDEVVVGNGVLSVGGGAGHTALTNALSSAGYSNNLHKYLVFAEGNRIGGNTCGLGNYYQDARPGAENWNNGGGNTSATVARVDTVCWFSNNSSSTTTHELIHTFGGVLSGAPNATLHGHCHDARDPMCYDDGSGMPMRSVCTQTGAALQLDCNKDDYFNVSPPAGSYLANNWNIANSMFLTTVPDSVDPWENVTVAVNPSPMVTGQESSVLVTGAPEGTTVRFSTPNQFCTVSTTGTPSVWGIRGTLTCTAQALGSGGHSTAQVTVTAALTHPDLVPGSRSTNVTLNRGATPTPVLTAPASLRANVTTDLSATAAGATPLVWNWQVSDSRCVLTGPSTRTPTISCPASVVGSTVSVTATAQAADGQADSSTVYLEVVEQYQTSVTISGPAALTTGTNNTFTATVTEAPPGATVTYAWTDTNGAIVGSATQPSVTVRPTTGGSSTLSVVATVNGRALTSSTQYSVQQAYTVTVTSNVDSARADEPITFEAAAVGTSVGITSYSWSFNAAAAECRITQPATNRRVVTCPPGFSGALTATAQGSAPSAAGTVTASGTKTVQLTPVPYDASFTQTPAGTVGNNKPGSFTVTASLPTDFAGWEVTPVTCVVGNTINQTSTVATATVTCPANVSGRVDLKVTARELSGTRTRALSSSMLVADPPPALPAVTGLTRTGYDTSSMSLSWNPVPGTSTYIVQYSTDQKFTTYSSKNTTASGTTLTGLRAGTIYFVRVLAQVGASTTTPTGPVPFTTAPNPTPTKPPATVKPLAAPTGLKMRARTSKSLTPQWNRSAGASKYVVYYGTRSNGKGAKSRTVGNVASVRLSGLKPRTRYYVRVVAVAGSRKSPPSRLVGMTTLRDKKPGRAGKPKVTARSSSALTLRWAKSSGAVRYRVYYGSKSNGKGAKFKSVKGTSYTVRGLSSKRKYFVFVVAYSEGGLASSKSSRQVGRTR